ncbi:MAG: energy transducer TonB [Candidatus Eremiobacteraeota bacterium]|nr:energy transducer TonB [Candidatus Eremiobacteraeota bacterium]MBV8282299.1 energy transducer TonB [Candidatus Eremiobacteraeota bacterium]
MSFTPGAPLRRSFKEDREERKRKKSSRHRVRLVALLVVLVLVGAGAWVAYARPDLSAILQRLQHVSIPSKPTPNIPVLPTRASLAYHALKPGAKLALATPTPLPTTTPKPTPTPLPTPTPTPGPKKTPAAKPKPAGPALRTLTVAAGNTFALPPTPAVIASTAPTIAPATAAPATATPGAEVFAPEIVVDARFANRIQPEYPQIARDQNIAGTAVVLVTVGPKGNVLSQRLEKSAGHPALDQAALNAASRSSFLPPKIDGKPATETYRVVYTFTP